jgi:hypothetical protein
VDHIRSLAQVILQRGAKTPYIDIALFEQVAPKSHWTARPWTGKDPSQFRWPEVSTVPRFPWQKARAKHSMKK